MNCGSESFYFEYLKYLNTFGYFEKEAQAMYQCREQRF